jgi:hypothetical protein
VTALLELEPREAGTEVVDPIIDFGGGQDDLHVRNRCAASSVCGGNHTLICINTQ